MEGPVEGEVSDGGGRKGIKKVNGEGRDGV